MAREKPRPWRAIPKSHSLLSLLHLPEIGTIYTFFGILACGNEDGGEGVSSRV